jgi:sugar phosphate isomerase/epimerase
MTDPQFVLSAFGDEINKDLQTQVNHWNQLQVHYLEFRSAWGTNVKDLDDDQLASVQRICADARMGISCIGSPIGKSPIRQPLEQEINTLTRIFHVCDVLGTRHIRVFAFYPPDREDRATYDSFVDEATARLAHLTEMAQREGCTLLLENDEELVADNLERTHALLSRINSPHLRFAWDGANFVRSGVPQPTTRGWDRLGSYVGTAHIKDARQDRSQPK